MARSGSSLLGSLMSLHPSTSYTYEPFHQEKFSCAQRYNNSDIAGLVENRLMGILNCEPDVVSKMKRFSRRKNTRKCDTTNIRVVKTIRVHLNGVLPWLHKYPFLKVILIVLVIVSSPFSKIIHLVRDPRYQYQSRFRMRGIFKCEKKSVSAYCAGYSGITPRM